jgi:translation elongation factor EF-G
VSHDELNKYMQQINVIVCLMNSKGNQIPGKVYHDASSTKDILFIKDGEYGDKIQEFFQKYDHYTFVNNDVESIDKAIKNYVNTGVPVREPVVDFQAVNIARKLIES